LEQEADQIAREVLRMPDSGSPVSVASAAPGQVQRKCAKCAEEEEGEEKVHRKSQEPGQSSTVAGPGLDAKMRSARAGGSALPEPVRRFFEPRFGHDFSHVRVHTDSRAGEAAQALDARAYTVGADIVFGSNEFDPSTPNGQELVAHELAHVVQQGSGQTDGTIQRACLSAAACATPHEGSAEEFVAEVEDEEKAARDRRARMSPARQRASGHTGPAKQLQIFLEAQTPGLLANVHGIFVDQDMSDDVAASVQACDSMIPPILGATKPCVFVPGHLNQEALKFNTDPKAGTIGGQSRESWRIDTLQTLTHEIQHVVYDVAKAGQPVPGGVACSRSTVEAELSELNAIMSEFPIVFNAVPVGAGAGDPAKKRLDDWFDFAITNTGESFRGILKALRCRCSCSDVDAYVKETFDFVTASWTSAQKDALNAELRKPLWALSWPL
jgi:hypothetical protein